MPSALPTAEAAPIIHKIDIKFTGVASVTEEVVRANMSLREGMAYDQTLVDRDLRSLYRTGLFDSIEVQRLPADNGQIDLIFAVRPKFRVGAIRFEGNKKMSTSRLNELISSKSNFALDEHMVKEDSDKLIEHYRKAGYSQARVEYVIDRNPVTGFGTIVFKIQEGRKVHISLVNFVGNQKIKTKHLLKEMETARWRWWSWLTGSGKYEEKTFEDDLDKLRDFYRDKGFLDVEIDAGKVTFGYPGKNKMTITIPVVEGKQYKIGEITITGNKLFPADLIRHIARIDTGDVFSPTKLDDETKRIHDFYGQFGYLETEVRLIRRPNLSTGAIDLEFNVQESDRYQVESVNIEGNTKTKSIVVLREVLLAPGDVFDSVRMETSKARLENTRFFEDVNVTDESTNIPDRKNLKISFKEGRTGNLTFGAGFNSVEKASFFIELTQSNFDLFNRRSFFQGDGQKFRIKAQIGSLSNELVLAFEEPYLFERELALGFQIYRQRSDYISSYFDEIDTGFEVYLRKRLFELVSGRLSYDLENTEIANVTANLGIPAGKTLISSVSLQLLRDTRNNLITATRGSRIQGTLEVAGGPFAGDVDFYRLEGMFVQYLPLFEAQSQTLEVLGRLGTVQKFGSSGDVPYQKRYFLGGPNDLRGFEYRLVGPKSAFGQPIGGKTMGQVGLEYSVEVVNQVRFAAFYDGGFLNKGSFDINPGSYNDDWGFGIRFFLMGSPLRLDYAIPITNDGTNKKGNQFLFNFGTKF